jgi:hypothetical protein
MRSSLRESALCALAAAAGCLVLAWLGLYGYAWTDYEVEVQPALQALAHGHVSSFLALAPAYGGSLVLRAPFALLPSLWGGGPLAVYRAAAAPCLLASTLLAIWFAGAMRARGASMLARALAVGLCAANPITLLALEVGHPEELLGACLCVGAALLAIERGPRRAGALAAGALLGLAIANKPWALVAVGPVLLALPPGRRAQAAGACLLTGAAVLAPLLLSPGGGFAGSVRASASTGSTIFQPWQLWWFFGHHGAPVHGLFGQLKPGYRAGPAWTTTISHPLVLAAGAGIAVALWPRARTRALDGTSVLLALAVVLLARCLLDTWDTSYYALPFLLALLAFEVRRTPREQPLPMLSLAATAGIWASFKWLPEHVSADTQAALFLAWTLPLLLWLGARLLRPDAPAQETTVSSFGRLVSTSWPPSRTTARSSIRTPSSPGT